MSHIGSTAIHDIRSKDIVDVLVDVGVIESLPSIAETLEKLGFIKMSKSPSRISLNTGYTLNGFAEEAFHVHLCYRGDNDELYFRDYLNEHPEVARAYEALKLKLCAKYKYDRDAYTDAKAEFVHAWSKAGRLAYKGRY